MEYRTQPKVRQREQRKTHWSREMRNDDDCCGILPECGALANPYVPFQRNNPSTYPAKEGVVRGTLFPALNLPFMGKINTQPLSDSCLHELQTLCFALVELGQYLDTHADDREAFDLFQAYGKLYEEGRAKYEKMYGPLTQTAAAWGDCYAWLKDPWPWEFEANCRKEG